MWSVLDTIFEEKLSVDLFEFSDTKNIDSKLPLIKYMHCYLAKLEFCFLWIKRLPFGFCSNQCLISAVKFSKTHTTLVQFLGRSGRKRKKTENTTVLGFEDCCQRLSLKAWFVSLLIFFNVAYCVSPDHKFLTSSATPQNKHLYSPRTIGGASSISLLLDCLFTLSSFFLSSSLFLFYKDLFNFWWLFETELWW